MSVFCPESPVSAQEYFVTFAHIMYMNLNVCFPTRRNIFFLETYFPLYTPQVKIRQNREAVRILVNTTPSLTLLGPGLHAPSSSRQSVQNVLF